jgi:hypothetical protein
MNTLLQLQQALTQALHADPLYQLVLLTVMLDPLWQHDPDEFEYGEGDVQQALLIARRVFPDLYTDGVLALQQGMTTTELERWLCRGFGERGIPVEDIAWLGYGIPLIAGGVSLHDPELYENEDFATVLSWFGLEAGEDGYVDIADETCTAARLLATSLRQQPALEWQNVGWLIAWLFGYTNNSLADMDDEALCEIEPLTWDADDVQFAIELTTECQTIIEDAYTGLRWLLAHPAAYQQVRANLLRVQQVVTRNKHPRQVLKVRLEWV